MRTATLAFSLIAIAAASAPASAASVAALLEDNRIAIVDTATYAAAEPMTVSGVESTLVGIDVRPADGKLYGLAADGTVVTIDPMSGAATKVSTLDTMLPDNAVATVDFNPVADRLRVMGSDGTNLRANVDDGKVTTDGKLAFAEADMHKGETPNIVAGAYTNSMAGATETALYDIDATIGGLIRQAPPNDGVLNAVGKLGVTAETYAFDILAGADGKNDGWLMAGDTLYAVNLETGAATALGKVSGVSGPVLDIAAMPAM
ncbi:DUF4394 domain-containing protein [Mongoliimonas terrestris]|uniref:DUF4394 domain-containing protein n=1 Tax=Mongoliimonas terrestris TaxID=1709001 RepID=UPI00094987BF|nr:DUF4394 domain-containing protein [Mongoliimonas terrestris]